MKSDKFLSAIGNIDDDFIEEAAELNSPQAKRPIRKLWVRYGSLAACLLIAVLCTFLAGGGIKANPRR